MRAADIISLSWRKSCSILRLSLAEQWRRPGTVKTNVSEKPVQDLVVIVSKSRTDVLDWSSKLSGKIKGREHKNPKGNTKKKSFFKCLFLLLNKWRNNQLCFSIHVILKELHKRPLQWTFAFQLNKMLVILLSRLFFLYIIFCSLDLNCLGQT